MVLGQGEAMRIALRIVCVMALMLMAMTAVCQSDSNYKAAQLLDVNPHQPATEQKVYDLTVKIDSTIFIVLFEPPDGTNTIEYKKGQDFLALVEGETMKVNDLLGQSHTLKILSRKPAEEKKGS